MSYFHAINGQGGSPAPSNDHPPVLLWENPSPTSNFAGQTISLDLSNYAGVIVEFNSDSYGIFSSRSYLKKNEEINTTYFGAGFAKDTDGGVGRRYTINNTGVTFENGYYLNNSNNGVMIPTKIYGVQEYVVEVVGTTAQYIGGESSNTPQFTIPKIEKGFIILTASKYGGGSNLDIANFTLSSGSFEKVVSGGGHGGSNQTVYSNTVILKVKNVEDNSTLSIETLDSMPLFGFCSCSIIK